MAQGLVLGDTFPPPSQAALGHGSVLSKACDAGHGTDLRHALLAVLNLRYGRRHALAHGLSRPGGGPGPQPHRLVYTHGAYTHDTKRQLSEDIRRDLPEFAALSAGSALTVDAGSVVIMHYDLPHRGSRAQHGAKPRPMFKFQFYRASEPEAGPAPEDGDWDTFAKDGPYFLLPAWRDAWRYLHGADDTVRTKMETLWPATSESARVGRAVYLGRSARSGDAGALQELSTLLKSPVEAQRRAAVRGLGAAGATDAPVCIDALKELAANQGLARYAASCLAESGTDAGVRALANVVVSPQLDGDPLDAARAAAADALGITLQHFEHGAVFDSAVDALATAVLREHVSGAPTGFGGGAQDNRAGMAAQALSKLAAAGRLADSHRARDALVKVANTRGRGDRYVYAAALEALAHFDDAAARATLDALPAPPRWCPFTSPMSQF